MADAVSLSDGIVVDTSRNTSVSDMIRKLNANSDSNQRHTTASVPRNAATDRSELVNTGRRNTYHSGIKEHQQ